MSAKRLTVDGIIAEQMRKIGAMLPREKRQANARRAWQTRRANIAAKLAESEKAGR